MLVWAPSSRLLRQFRPCRRHVWIWVVPNLDRVRIAEEAGGGRRGALLWCSMEPYAAVRSPCPTTPRPIPSHV